MWMMSTPFGEGNGRSIFSQHCFPTRHGKHLTPTSRLGISVCCMIIFQRSMQLLHTNTAGLWKLHLIRTVWSGGWWSGTSTYQARGLNWGKWTFVVSPSFQWGTMDSRDLHNRFWNSTRKWMLHLEVHGPYTTGGAKGNTVVSVRTETATVGPWRASDQDMHY